MNVLITGPGGFLGGNLIKEIEKRKLGWNINILARPESNLNYISNIKFNKIIGDITDIESIKKAFKDIDVIFHCAAFFTLELGQKKQLDSVNVKGTDNVLKIAQEMDVSKIIYTSTGATTGIPAKGNIANEDTQFNKHSISNDYTLSKYNAEKVALDYVNKGMNICILNPVAPVGKGDIKPTPTGQFVIKYIKKKIYYYMDAITHYVHIADVVDAHIKAVDKGRSGEKYLIGNDNLYMSEIYSIMEKATGISSKRIVKLPYSFSLLSGHLIDLLKKYTPYQTTLGSEVVKYAKSTPIYDFSKAKNELKISQTPLLEAFKESKQWFEKNGKV